MPKNDIEDMTNDHKIRLGLYIFTPMIGGAELYFKDLLWNINREEFEVTVFCEPWKEFIDFLDLTHCPPTNIYTFKMYEVGGHYGAKELTDRSAPKQLSWWEKFFLRVIAAQKRLQSPFLKVPGRIGRSFMQYGFLMLNTLRLLSAFRKHPIDVLHVINGGYPGAQSAQLAALLAKRAGCQVALMSVCNTPVPYHFPKILELFLDRLVKKSFNALIVPGDFIGKLLIDLRGFHPSQLKKIPEGVAVPEQYGARISTTHAQSIDIMTITMVAGFLAHKGHRFLLEALALLHPEFPNIHTILIGDGPLLNEMRQLTKQLDISEVVTFEGFRPLPETLQIMSRADLFVHPALMEGMPYVILHAMSLGKPVIATPVGDISEVVLHGQTGYLVPAGNSTALAYALKQLLTDQKRIQEMGIAGKKRYNENHTVNIMVERHTSLYKTFYNN